MTTLDQKKVVVRLKRDILIKIADRADEENTTVDRWCKNRHFNVTTLYNQANKVDIKLGSLMKVADALGCKVSELLEECGL